MVNSTFTFYLMHALCAASRVRLVKFQFPCSAQRVCRAGLGEAPSSKSARVSQIYRQRWHLLLVCAGPSLIRCPLFHCDETQIICESQLRDIAWATHNRRDPAPSRPDMTAPVCWAVQGSPVTSLSVSLIAARCMGALI
jgi:hypothetical protein